MSYNKELLQRLDDIYTSDQPPIDKVAQSFDAITQMYLGEYGREIEIYAAAADEDSLNKTRIQRGMVQMMRDILNECYRRATGDAPMERIE